MNLFQTKIKRKPNRAWRSAGLEGLEERVVLSSAGVHPGSNLTITPAANPPGVINVNGTSGDDMIVAANVSGKLQVTVNGTTIVSDVAVNTVTQLNISGNDGNDTIRTVGLAVPTTISGGNGNDTVYIDGTSGNDTFTINATSVVFNGATISSNEPFIVEGLAGNDTFNVNAANANAGLVGGADNDTFVFNDGASIKGPIDGGPGTNTIDESNVSTPVALNLSTHTISGVGSTLTRVQNVIGGSSVNTLTGPSANMVYTIDGPDSIKVGTVALSRFGSINGGSANDTFKFADGATLSGSIDGGDGTNTIDESLASSNLNVNAATMQITGLGGSFANIQAIKGGTGANTLTGPSSDSTFRINGKNSGSLIGAFTFTNFATLTGGVGNDSFAFVAGGGITGSIDGGSGTNTLDYSGYSQQAVVDLSRSAASCLVNPFANIQAMTGGSNNANTLVGPAANATFVISGANSGTVGGFTFTKAARLIGGAGNDVFQFVPGGGITGSIIGGSGTNTLDYSSFSSQVVIDLSKNIGSCLVNPFMNIQQFNGGSNTANAILGPSAGTTYYITGPNAENIGSQNFNGFGRIVGGGGDDVFTMSTAGSLTNVIDGGGGSNWIDFAPLKTSITVNLSAGGASGINAGISNIENARGGSGDDMLVGDGKSNILIGGPGNDVINETAGRNILIGGYGSDQINGGSGDEILIGGPTIYDGNFTALDLILDEWKSSDDYQTRIDKISNGGGPNGSARLIWGTTVFNDSTVDGLLGNAGREWFFKGDDDYADNAPNEQLN